MPIALLVKTASTGDVHLPSDQTVETMTTVTMVKDVQTLVDVWTPARAESRLIAMA